MGLFISKAVTLGNRLDVNESEMLDFFYDDPDTKQILMYLEGAADGRLLMDTLKKVSRKKPVLVLKSGRTSVGKAATASHTGSLSGEDELYRDMFAQTGAIRAETLEELVQFNRMFNALALPKGNRLGVVTSSGSMGALTADAAIAAGLVLPGLSDETKAKVKQGAPSWMNVYNPLDVGPSGQYSQAFNALMDDPDIDMVLAIIAVPYSVLKQFLDMGMPADRFFGDFSSIAEKARTKPVAMCVVGHSEFVQHMRNITEPEIPVLESPETAAKGMAALWQYSKWRAAH